MSLLFWVSYNTRTASSVSEYAESKGIGGIMIIEATNISEAEYILTGILGSRRHMWTALKGEGQLSGEIEVSHIKWVDDKLLCSHPMFIHFINHNFHLCNDHHREVLKALLDAERRK